jgi:CRP/FNR family transcriptional regulator, anaerobic regulatory protein
MITIENWLRELSAVTEEELAAIYEIAETSFVPPNELIHKQGQVSSRIGLLLQGATRTVYTDIHGNEKNLAFTFEGKPLAEIDSFLNKVPCAVSSYTLEPSVIIWTNYEGFSSFTNRFPRYNIILIKALARWFSDNSKRMEYLHLGSAKARYDMMCKLHPEIIERVPLMHIASYLNVTQQTLSRIRRKK